MFCFNYAMRPRHGALLSCATAALCAAAASTAQSTLQTQFGSQSGGFFGAEVAAVGDLDNDGVADYAVGATGEQSFTGRVHVYSGSTHALINVITGGDAGASFGDEIAGLGDINNDGFDDVLITAPAFSLSIQSQNVGRVFIYSGQWIVNGTGSQLLYSTFGQIVGPLNPNPFGDFLGVGAANLGNLDGDGTSDFGIGARDVGGTGYVLLKSGGSLLAGLGVLVGTNSGDGFGISMASIGDVVGSDNRDEFVVGAYQLDSGGPGYVRAFSFDLTSPYTVTGDNDGDRFGNSVAGIGDVDGDGNGDFAVGAPGGSTSVGYARVFSGVDGSVLYTLSGDGPGDRFGTSVDGCGDLDGDGVADLIVGAPGDPFGTLPASPGFARVFSGATGAVLFTMQGDASTAASGGSDEYGSAVAAIGDLDGDGRSELLVGAARDDNGGNDAGAARVHSGTALTPYISGDKTQLTVTTGGTLTLQMQSTPALAGSFYMVLGSASGSTPGIVQDGVQIPLNIDGYFNSTLNNANLPINGNGIIAVDGLGQATVPLAPGSSPNLIGVTVTHATVILAQPIPFVQAASNPFHTVITL